MKSGNGKEGEATWKPPNWVIVTLALTVTFVWATSFVADIIQGEKYEPPIAIHGAMLVVLGSIFGFQLIKK